jgi:probable HAF family extracellular repeat protein
MMWTQDAGIQLLADVEGVALGVSGDGSSVVGASTGQAFRWTKDKGLQQIVSGDAFAASFDGSVIVGRTSGWQAFRWTEQSGVEQLGDLPGGIVASEAHDVSADGSIVVGWSSTDKDETAFIWDARYGMRDLHDVLNQQGVELVGWHLTSVEAVSADGLTLVGQGRNPAGDYEAWAAVIPEPNGRILILSSLLVVVGRLRRGTLRGEIARWQKH